MNSVRALGFLIGLLAVGAPAYAANDIDTIKTAFKSLGINAENPQIKNSGLGHAMADFAGSYAGKPSANYTTSFKSCGMDFQCAATVQTKNDKTETIISDCKVKGESGKNWGYLGSASSSDQPQEQSKDKSATKQ